jgi:hypothetical protein
VEQPQGAREARGRIQPIYVSRGYRVNQTQPPSKRAAQSRNNLVSRWEGSKKFPRLHFGAVPFSGESSKHWSLLRFRYNYIDSAVPADSPLQEEFIGEVAEWLKAAVC